MTPMVKNLPAMQETPVQSLGQEDPLVKETAIHFNIFAWRIPWTKEPGRLSFMGSQRVGHDCATNTKTHLKIVIIVKFLLCVFSYNEKIGKNQKHTSQHKNILSVYDST